jgi:hypothetical protein
VTLGSGLTLGVSSAVVNSVPHFLHEVAEARADRSVWSQTAEFASLMLDSGWAWAALAVIVGWQVSTGISSIAGALLAASAGCVALIFATVAYNSMEWLFQGGVAWGAAQFWLAGCLILGPPLGAVGFAVRRAGAVGVVAALVVPVGAAVNMVVMPPPPDSAVAEYVRLAVWVGAAAAVAAILARAIFAHRRDKGQRSRLDDLQRSSVGG